MDCQFCTDVMEKGSGLIHFSDCEHSYHMSCLDAALPRNHTCDTKKHGKRVSCFRDSTWKKHFCIKCYPTGGPKKPVTQ